MGKQRRIPMKDFVSITALAIALAFAAPVFAGTAAPSNKTDCEKAGMVWNAAADRCELAKM
jgi:hypothetical protein